MIDLPEASLGEDTDEHLSKAGLRDVRGETIGITALLVHFAVWLDDDSAISPAAHASAGRGSKA